MRTSEQTTTLIAALVTAHGAFKPIVKDAIGAVGKDRPIKYADLAGILDAVMPSLLANGLLVLQVIDAESSSLITRLVHTSGEWVESVYPLRLEQPSAQAFGSALTYGRRYSLQSLLCLAAADDDGSAATSSAKQKTEKPKAEKPPATITPAQRKKLIDAGDRAGWSQGQMKAFLERQGIPSTKDIPLAAYDDILIVFSEIPLIADPNPAA